MDFVSYGMMRKIPLVLCLLGLLIAGCKRSHYDSEWLKMDHDGIKRTYLLHVPDSYDGSQAVSLVVALHGGVGSAKNIESQSLLSELSDREGFIACYPTGERRTWNAGWCCGKAEKNDHDDVGFISALIDKLLGEYAIDPGRVYVTGMSNGAMMSYRLACEIPEKIAAIAPVAGSMTMEVCNPGEPVPVIHFHSFLDSNIPYDGGIGDGISEHYNPPLDSVLDAWATHNGCVVKDTLLYSGSDYDQRLWTSCTDSSEIHLYLTQDGGHSWPGGTRPRLTADDPSAYIDAGELMWAFFQAHPKP